MSAFSLRIPAVLLAASAALLAACGSSGNTTGSSTSTSSTSTPSGGGAAAAQSTTPCSTAQFGSPLQPKDAPSDVHVYSSAPARQIDTGKLYLVTIKTAKGDIGLCLQPKLAPNTVNNFVVLARNHFYDGLKFHRVVQGFVIQGGDPQGTGSGGPGYQFADEPVQGEYTAGCVAMANAGPNTNGSQFFVCTANDTQLPKQYNLFGQVSKGMDVVLQIAAGDTMSSVAVQEQS
ncbi:MAG TPA: peptidylprolyl isomerase [Candidatus Angelobacter sp.]|jgi:cyclophilin family peptidyl-prolyl cis-trans isomerase|nr:peptidylprolyl isomerase [Candidatus Angelobacter sp.]